METAFLVNVPYYWPPVEINGALDALGLDPSQSMAAKARWSVVDIRTYTYRVEAPSVKDALNKTLRTSNKAHTLVVISESEYQTRCAPRVTPGQTALLSGGRGRTCPQHAPPPPSVGPLGQASFNFKRKRTDGGPYPSE